MGFFKKDISEPVWMIAKSLDNLEEWDVFGADSYFKSEFVHKATGLILTVNVNSHQVRTIDFQLTNDEKTYLINKCVDHMTTKAAQQNKADREIIINKFKELEK